MAISADRFFFIFFGHFSFTHDILVLWVWLAVYTSIGTQNVPLASKYMLTDTSQTLRYFQMLVQMLMQPSKMYPEPGFPDTIEISCKKLSLWPCISCTPHSAAPQQGRISQPPYISSIGFHYLRNFSNLRINISPSKI